MLTRKLRHKAYLKSQPPSRRKLLNIFTLLKDDKGDLLFKQAKITTRLFASKAMLKGRRVSRFLSQDVSDGVGK